MGQRLGQMRIKTSRSGKFALFLYCPAGQSD
jgi:hypothetical protein